MKVVRPTNNQITRGYSNTHRGYDFAGLNLPDEVRVGMAGVIAERVDQYNSNWSNTGVLTTADYGNYIKIKHDDGSFELHAHLRKGSSLNQGTRVNAGQIVARIGNTGNSTGPHLHSEYRTSGNINTQVEFVTSSPQPMEENIKRKSGFFDLIWQAYTNPTIDTDKATNDQVKGFITWFKSNRDRAGRWDQLFIKSGGIGDSNQATVDGLYETIKNSGQAFDKKSFIDKIIAWLKTQ